MRFFELFTPRFIEQRRRERDEAWNLLPEDQKEVYLEYAIRGRIDKLNEEMGRGLDGARRMQDKLSSGGLSIIGIPGFSISQIASLTVSASAKKKADYAKEHTLPMVRFFAKGDPSAQEEMARELRNLLGSDWNDPKRVADGIRAALYYRDHKDPCQQPRMPAAVFQ